MDIAMIGLGKMGANMARRLLQGGHRVVGLDQAPDAAKKLAEEVKIVPAASLAEAVKLLPTPRVLWVMVPSGAPTEAVITELAGLLAPDDVIIDGGNTYYKDDMRRAAALKPKGIHYVDAGTSGGVWGAERGYCLMIGGDETIVRRIDPIFAALAPDIAEAPRTPGREKVGGTAEHG